MITFSWTNNTKDDAGTSPGVKYLTVLPCLEAQGQGQITMNKKHRTNTQHTNINHALSYVYQEMLGLQPKYKASEVTFIKTKLGSEVNNKWCLCQSK